MTSLLMRPAVAADLDAVVAIERASFSDPWSRTTFADAIAGPRIRFEVAETAGGDVIGYAISAFVADEGEVLNLAVDAAHRGSRIGSALLGRVVLAARGEKIATIHLEVRESNASARAVYARLGFLEAGRRSAYYRNPTEDALVLRLTVADAAIRSGAAAE